MIGFKVTVGETMLLGPDGTGHFIPVGIKRFDLIPFASSNPL